MWYLIGGAVVFAICLVGLGFYNYIEDDADLVPMGLLLSLLISIVWALALPIVVFGGIGTGIGYLYKTKDERKRKREESRRKKRDMKSQKRIQKQIRKGG